MGVYITYNQCFETDNYKMFNELLSLNVQLSVYEMTESTILSNPNMLFEVFKRGLVSADILQDYIGVFSDEQRVEIKLGLI